MKQEKRIIRKILSTALALLIMMSVLWIIPFEASADIIMDNEAAPDEVCGDWKYNLRYDNTAIITGYLGSKKELEIPSELDGHSVSTIGAKAFMFSNITEVTLPNSVSYIESNAFNECTALKKVTLTDYVYTIGEKAFMSCVSLKSVTLPRNLYTLSKGAFEYCTSLKSIKIPGVYYIESSVFFGCSALESVYFLTKAQHIENNAFYGCSALKDVYSTPAEDEWKDSSIQFGNEALTNAQWHYGYVFDSYDYTVLDNGTIEITKYTGVGSDVTVPSELDGYTVTRLGKSAFAHYRLLKSVILPDTLEYIGMWAFEESDYLTRIIIPKKTQVEERAFLNCTALEEITVDAENPYHTSVDGVLFSKDMTVLHTYPVGKGITSYNVPEGVKRLATGAIYNNTDYRLETRLESVTLPESLEAIDKWAFYNCGLDTLYIPKNVKEIGCTAFMQGQYCINQGLKNIQVDKDNKTFCSVDGALYTKDMKKICFVPSLEAQKAFVIPEYVEIIGEKAFYADMYLGQVFIPDSVKVIEDDAFCYCYSLKSVELPEGLTYIGDRAFLGCTRYSAGGMDAVTVSYKVKYIGEMALGYYAGQPLAYAVVGDAFVLTGYSGTSAERYAEQNGIKFVSLGEAPAEPEILLGDADDDGEVTILDATCIQRHLVGLSVEAYNEEAADADGDDEVTILDATAIQRHLVGLSANEDIGKYI